MSSIFSTQKRQTFFRRKYCFLPTAAALSPPVGRCEAAIGLPPFGCSAMGSLLIPLPACLLRLPACRAPDVRGLLRERRRVQPVRPAQRVLQADRARDA